MNKGFTILEVMLAISILTVAVGGSFILIQQSLVAASLSQSRLTAAYLSQEGIEIVRNIRDSNWLEQRIYSVSWDEGISANLQIGETDNYIADYNNSQLSSFEDKTLNLDTNGFYGYSPGEPTKFKRKITITKLDANTLEAIVEVQFTERGRIHTIEATEHLYNWYGYE